MSIDHKTYGHKTKALALSKRVPQLFSAIVSSYRVVFRDGDCHLTMLPERKLNVWAILYTRERLLSCSCIDACPWDMRSNTFCSMRCHRLSCCECYTDFAFSWGNGAAICWNRGEIFVCSIVRVTIVGKMILVMMGFERKTSGHKMKALAKGYLSCSQQ